MLPQLKCSNDFYSVISINIFCFKIHEITCGASTSASNILRCWKIFLWWKPVDESSCLKNKNGKAIRLGQVRRERDRWRHRPRLIGKHSTVKVSLGHLPKYHFSFFLQPNYLFLSPEVSPSSMISGEGCFQTQNLLGKIENKPKEFKTCRCLQLFPGGVMYRVSSFDHSSHQFKEKENENPEKGRHSLRKACLTSLNVSLLLDKYQMIYVTNLTS